ncbi:diguanylate cyclase [Pigmentiphaga soli]|uniref:Diguanylate cyclase n=1 Tax=Pigmentiphaga soli TaxID=1007095 RepID=A0ABP8GRC7_9BURK
MPPSPPARPRILVVDDTPANLFAMRRLLAHVDADVVTAESGNEALALCLDQQFALILLDVNMPDMDGYEVATLLGESPEHADTPIIFVTAAYDDVSRLKGYRAGAVDYIAKPVNDAILLSKVGVFLELYLGRQRLAAALASLEQRNRQLNAEIAERRRIEDRMRHQATHDMLTGLPNRMLFIETLDRCVERAVGGGAPFALVYIDIDGFKAVNDGCGHHAGDLLLQAIAGRLRVALRGRDMIARLGGDEFAALMEDVGDAEAGLAYCRRIGAALRDPYRLDVNGATVEADIGASIGLALCPLHGRSRDALIQAADNAMYEAKRDGKNHSRLAALPAA